MESRPGSRPPRRALPLFAALCLAVPALAQDQAGPGEEQVTAAVAALESAFEQRDPALREAALAEHRVAHPDVVKLIGRGLNDDEERVKRAALEALRYTPHEDALALLHKTAKRDKTLRKHEELAPVLYRAIGWHANRESLSILDSGLFSDPNPAAIRARILAMGNIRHRDSIEGLLQVGRKARGRRVQPYVDEIRLSMTMLLGVDRGESLARWHEYWESVEKEFVMAPKPPRLPQARQQTWDRFWGLENRMQRGSRREDRTRDRDSRR